jgi:hypothetical protein
MGAAQSCSQGKSVLVALAVAYDQLVPAEINILDAEANALHQT